MLKKPVMRDKIRLILGKRIQSVVTSADNRCGPPGQLFLIFDDDTVYEFYGTISGTSNLTGGGAKRAEICARKSIGKVTVYD